MRYICLGYLGDSIWQPLTEPERKGWVGQCLAYDTELAGDGHLVRGEALQGVSAATLRSRGGGVVVTDGPFAETKEQLGGVIVLDAVDLSQAVQLMSRHPSVLMGGTREIRPEDNHIVALYQSAGVHVGDRE
jgi:hypothetical protein